MNFKGDHPEPVKHAVECSYCGDEYECEHDYDETNCDMYEKKVCKDCESEGLDEDLWGMQ